MYFIILPEVSRGLTLKHGAASFVNSIFVIMYLFKLIICDAILDII